MKPISEAHDYMFHKEYFVGQEKKKKKPVLDFEKVTNLLSFFPYSRHKQLQGKAFKSSHWPEAPALWTNMQVPRCSTPATSPALVQP